MTVVEFEILDALRRWGPLTAAELRVACSYPEQRTYQGYAAKLVQLADRGFVRRKGDRAWELADRAEEVLSA